MKKRLLALLLSALMLVSALPAAALDFKDTGYLWGDVNRDLGVDNRDATTLLRSLAGWQVELDEADADVNVDDAFDNRDVTMMLRYLAGWDVVLGEESMYEDVVLATGGQTNYSIVYGSTLGLRGENGPRFGGEDDAAADFYGYAKYVIGLDGIAAGKDTAVAESDYEIVVGITNREGEETFTVPRETLEDEGFVIRQYGKKIIIAGGTDEGTTLGLDYFMANFLLPYKLALEENPDAQLVIPGGYYHIEKQSYNVGKITIGGVDLSEFTIVHGKDAYVAEETAALELQHYLYRATGIQLPVVTDDAEPTEHEIIVGLTNREGESTYTINRDAYGDDAFIIKTVGDDLVIAGAIQDGTLFGVYTFLEEYVGYRWYESFISTLPEQELVEIPADLEDEQIPVFNLEREAYWNTVINQDFWDGFQTKNKAVYNHNEIPLAYAGEAEAPNPAPSGHSFARWYPEVPGDSQPCLTDPEVYEIFLERILAFMHENPDCPMISVSQNDNANYCGCDNCNALAETYKSSNKMHSGQSGIMVWFVNKIADALEEAGYGDVMIHTFSYMYTVEPPVGITCDENIIMQLCPMGNCFAHSVPTDCRDSNGYGLNGTNQSFREYLRRWGTICQNISFWDYPTNFNYPLTPMINFTQMIQNFRLYANSNVTNMFSQGYTDGKDGEFMTLRAYYTAKLMWDPKMTTDAAWEIIDEFMASYYGAGWENIRTYIDILSVVSLQEDNHFGCGAEPSLVVPTEDYLPYIADVEALWDAAEEAATDVRTLMNVQRSRLSADYVTLNAVWTTLESMTEEERTAYYEDCADLIARCKAFGIYSESFNPDVTTRPETW